MWPLLALGAAGVWFLFFRESTASASLTVPKDTLEPPLPPLPKASPVPCDMAYAGSSQAPCFDPSKIDKAIQQATGPSGVGFDVRFGMVRPGIVGTYDAGASNMTVGHYQDSDVGGPSGARRLFVRVKTSPLDAGFPPVGTVIPVPDNAIIEIYPNR